MNAPFIVGDVVFLQAAAPHASHGQVIAAEIVAHNARYPELFDLWADGHTFGPVNVTHRGQTVLRARAPQWAINAVDVGPWGDK
jgi:hypothetical protein